MPNITIVQDAQSNIEAHGTGCQDIARKAKGFAVETFPMGDFETTREVWVEYNIDFLDEGGASSAWDIRFLPCCGLKVDNDRSWN